MICLLNVGVASLMYYGALTYLPSMDDKQAVEQLLAVAQPAYYVVVFVLLALALYFYIKNKAIRVWVSPSQLCIIDPTFGDFELLVNVNEIAEFKQTISAGSDLLSTGLLMKDGTYTPLVLNNYKLDRGAFFIALKKANSAIKVPASPYRYTKVRPTWAKKLRAKLGLSRD
jgi:hypothetical protein